MGNYERHQGNRMSTVETPKVAPGKAAQNVPASFLCPGIDHWKTPKWAAFVDLRNFSVNLHNSEPPGERFFSDAKSALEFQIWCDLQGVIVIFKREASPRWNFSFCLGLVHLHSCFNRSGNSPECSWDITKRNLPAIHLWEIREVCLTKPFLWSGSDFRVYTIPERPHNLSWSHFHNLQWDNC